MPSASTITLNDGQSTPVAHNFDPQSVSGDTAVLADRSSSTPAGQSKLVLTYKPANGQRSTTRIGVRINMPTEGTVDGVTKVLHTARFTGEVIIPDELDLAGRENMSAYIQNAFAHADIAGYIESLDPLY